MEFNEVLANRFSVRDYKSGPKLKPEQINKIIDAGRLAPSAKNRQPWIFKVLSISEKNTIAQMMIDYDAQEVSNSCNYTGESILDASVMILVLKKPDKTFITGDTLSIGAAIENMILEATNMGIGSLWIRDTIYVENEILKLIDRQDLELASSIIFGYADEIKPDKVLKPLNEVII